MPPNTSPLTLAIDIGGSGLKMMVLDEKAKALTTRTRIDTPHPATPQAVTKALLSMIPKHGNFDRVSIGFPGVVHHGVVKTAPNLDKSWEGYTFQSHFEKSVKKPVRIANDADVQGFGDIKGKGMEMVITLGTGMGAAIYLDGKLVPNLELGHHPFHKNKSYEDYLGNKSLKKIGKKKWNKHVKDAIALMERIFNFDHLYIGGGNAEKISFKLPKNVSRTSNIAGLLGGIRLWDK